MVISIFSEGQIQQPNVWLAEKFFKHSNMLHAAFSEQKACRKAAGIIFPLGNPYKGLKVDFVHLML